ncbi:MAG: hypothetical protein K8F25_08175, partial [Fimbriimonadaceae bacterium]|nr:hypothetical protein [Alphaproteobacteria bacterium]
AVARVPTPQGVTYRGTAHIDGVPGTASAIPITFKDTAGSSCGALLPTGNATDTIDNIDVTLIDNGMPVVILRARDLGVTGTESREQLDADTELKAKLEHIRLQAGLLMNLGIVRKKSVPKMTLISPAKKGGAIATRTFITHRCHASIGVLGAVSVASACILPGSPAHEMAKIPGGKSKTLSIEHPSGETSVIVELDAGGTIESAAILRTARKLFDGVVYADEG